MVQVKGWFWNATAAGISALAAMVATGCALPAGSEDVGSASSAGSGGAACVDPNNGTAMQDGECRCGSGEHYCCNNGTVNSTPSSCMDASTGTGTGTGSGTGTGTGTGAGSGVGNADTFGFGMCGVDDGASYRAFLALSKPQPHRCHIYTYWNIAQVEDPPRSSGAPVATGSHDRADLNAWFAGDAQTYCDEVLVTFQGAQKKNPATDAAETETAPTHTQFKDAFLAFLQVFTTDGTTGTFKHENSHWKDKLSFTAWNEPNNKAGGGNGLDENLTPEDAADYYLVAQNECNAPNSGCAKYNNVGLVAAGDFATNGPMGAYTRPNGEWAGSLALNCGDDEALTHGGKDCGSFSSHNPEHWGPSYLDRYKFFIASNVQNYKYLGKNFRPSYWAYHPWHDVNSYVDSNAACEDYEHCTTRRLLDSLTATWGSAEIWDTEISAGQQNEKLGPGARPPIHQDQSGQIELSHNDEGNDNEGWVSVPESQFQTNIKPCGEAFLAQLTELDGRTKRVYYMFYGYSSGSLMAKGDVPIPPLATLARNVEGAGCAATGFESTYSNPIIPMFSLVENEERDYVRHISPSPTEGCPDPQGMRTWDNHYYVYCTSYSLAENRFGAFPIFEANSLANNEWHRAGWIIPPKGGKAREEWPTWIKRDYGLFWGPDVHEIKINAHDHVYVALFGAPHEYKSHGKHVTHQSIGMAWSKSPTGPWTYYEGHPFVSSCGSGDSDCTHSACEGTNSKDCDGEAKDIKENGTCDTTNTYDPNLLIEDGHMYLYWVVAGNGIMAQEVKLKSDDGELEFAGSKPIRVSSKGEGPYAFHRDGTGPTYLFYSTSDDGLVDDYHVNVISSTNPLREVDFTDKTCGHVAVKDTWDIDPNPVVEKSAGTGWNAGAPMEVNHLAFGGTGGNSIIPNVNGTDVMFYHAVVVPQGPVNEIWCDFLEDTSAKKNPQNSGNPYCRAQGERQAMMDPLSWVPDSSKPGLVWPVVNGMTTPVPAGVTRSAAQASTGPVPAP
jgi:hypothetical protein